MKTDDPFAAPTTKSIARYVKQNAPKLRQTLKMKMGGHRMESIRQADYKGHHILVKTAYTINVDGRPFMAHLAVSNSGQVHYHGIPNMAFDSAIDLVEKAIDLFPSDFAGKPESSGMPGMSGH